MSPTRREGSGGLLGFQGEAMARSRELPTREGEWLVADEVVDASSRHRERGVAAGDVSTGIAGAVVEVANVEEWKGNGARA